VLITGRGVVSPLGCDWPSFASAVRARRAAPAAPFPGSIADDPPLCHPLSDTAALARSGARRDDEPLTALAIAAAEQALREAGISPNGAPLDGVGLVMSTALGPSGAVEAYLETLLKKGPRASRPALFVDTLLSMPASRLGIALRLRGSTAVLGGSSSFELARDWVRAGRDPAIVAGSGEYLSPKCARYFRELAGRSGVQRALLGQGAGFLVLESAARAAERRARPLGEILGAGAASEPQEVSVPWSVDPEGLAFASAMRTALAEAGVPPEAVGLVALAAGDDASEVGELAAVRTVLGAGGACAVLRPKRLFGEALGASAALSLLAVLAELEAAPEPTAALVNAFEMGGAVTSLIVRAPA
jgi:3-oxoacyl-[acyl-carrier-protein] synthase II